MEINLNEPVKPLGSDDFIFTVTEIEKDTPIKYGDILDISVKQEDLVESYEAFISQSESTDESRYPFVKLLVQSVGFASKITVETSGRFCNKDQDAKFNYEVSFNSVVSIKSNSELQEQAEKRRLSGNSQYGHKNYENAVKLYQTAIELLRKRSEVEVDASDILLKCQNNLAACQMQLDSFEAAIEALKEVEKVDSYNTKMLWRMGRCHMNMKKYDEAKEYLSKAKELDFGSKIITTDLNKVNEKLKEQDLQAKKMAEQMFSNIAKQPEVKENKLDESSTPESSEKEEKIEQKREIPKPPLIEREIKTEPPIIEKQKKCEAQPEVIGKDNVMQTAMIIGGIVFGVAAIVVSKLFL